MVIDPFAGGCLVSERKVAEISRACLGKEGDASALSVMRMSNRDVLARLLNNQAVRAENDNDPHRAMEVYRRITQIAPGVLDAWEKLARPQLVFDDVTGARAALSPCQKSRRTRKRAIGSCGHSTRSIRPGLSRLSMRRICYRGSVRRGEAGSQPSLENSSSGPLPAAEYQGMAYITPRVKLELGARGDPWPAEHKIIRPYAAEDFPDFSGDPDTTVTVLSARRTCWEKSHGAACGGPSSSGIGDPTILLAPLLRSRHAPRLRRGKGRRP